MVHENAYVSGSQKSIPAVLVYVRCGTSVLMVSRRQRVDDMHAGKCNGLGGKLELGESPWQAASREVAEEAGLMLPVARYRWLGTLTFPDFKAHRREDWVCAVMTAEVSKAEAATVWAEGPEGRLLWVEGERLLDLPLWEGDKVFLPRVLRGEPFNGTIWYRDGRMERADVRGV